MLCKHEVVGSIPSGSTTLRPSGYAWRSHAGAEGRSVPGVAFLGIDGLTNDRSNIVRENITSHVASLKGCACGISDIVKRRSIRVWDRKSMSQDFIVLRRARAFTHSLSPVHFGARPSQDG